MLDRLIRGGTIVDGTGTPRYRGDVGIKDGRVVEIGQVTDSAAEVVDAEGRIVAPGIVDMHTHLDGQVMWEPECTPSSIQGVTTAIGGNCGFSIAPITEESVDYVIHMLSAVEQMPIASLQAGLNPNWTSFAEWSGQIEGKSSLNVGFLVGHSTVRRLVMGEDWQRHATQAEVDKMKRLIDDAVTQGALGFSSSWNEAHSDHLGAGVPSRFAGSSELVQLSSVLKTHPGTILGFQPGSRADFSVESVDVMAGMSVAAGARLNWNALTIGTGVVDNDRDVVIARLASASDYAAERGGEVWAVLNSRIRERRGMKPFATFAFNRNVDWPEVMALPIPERTAAFRDPAMRARLEKSLAVQPMRNGFPNNFYVDHVENPALADLVGRSLEEIAAAKGCSMVEAFFDICIDDGFLSHFGSPNPYLDVHYKLMAELWEDPRCIVGGSDAGAHLDGNDSFKMYLEILGPHVRDRQLTTLERAVQLITDRPARFNNLVGRGRLLTGWQADIMIFDADTVAPGATYLRPDYPAGAERMYAEPIGIDRVMVNGVDIVVEGKTTGATPGSFLRSGRDQAPAVA